MSLILSIAVDFLKKHWVTIALIVAFFSLGLWLGCSHDAKVDSAGSRFRGNDTVHTTNSSIEKTTTMKHESFNSGRKASGDGLTRAYPAFDSQMLNSVPGSIVHWDSTYASGFIADVNYDKETETWRNNFWWPQTETVSNRTETTTITNTAPVEVSATRLGINLAYKRFWNSNGAKAELFYRHDVVSGWGIYSSAQVVYNFNDKKVTPQLEAGITLRLQ